MSDSPNASTATKGAVSPGKNLTASEDELSQIFTFDAPRPGASPQQQQQRSPYENVYPQSPRTRIRTTTKEMEQQQQQQQQPPPKPPLPANLSGLSSRDVPPMLKAFEAQQNFFSTHRFIRPLGTSDGALESHLKEMGGSLPNSPAPNSLLGVRRVSYD